MGVIFTPTGGRIYEHPLDGLIKGMQAGQQLRMDLQRAADEHQAFITNEAIHNRNVRMQDLIDTANFAAAGRPVKDGMVEMQGQLLGMPISRAEVPAPEPGAPPSLQNLPETQTQVGGAALGGAPYPYVRPVDKSLLKSRKDLQGREQQIEMYTPEEQLQRRIQMMGTENLMKALSDAQIREEMLKRTGFTPSPEMLAAKPGLPPRLTREEQIKEADEYAKAKATADKALILGKGAKAVTPTGKTIAENPEIPKPQDIMSQLQVDAMKLAPARQLGEDAYNRRLAQPDISDASRSVFAGAQTKEEVMQRALSPPQAQTAQHNLSMESNAKVNTAIQLGKLEQEKIINGMKYGPGTQEYWVQQLKDNPDSITLMPAEFRSSVGPLFREATGLPLPKAAGASTQTQEIAARNALDGISFIRKAIQNPEIRAQIGPIMGRLGNAEQTVGTAIGLSPQATQLAQELRTRMRYFVFQEGKAVLGGRLPQQLMKALEASSANVKMDSNMLEGALRGAEGSSQSVLDNVDRERFGGKMRSREVRGTAGTVQMKAPDGTVRAVPAEQVEHFKSRGATVVP